MVTNRGAKMVESTTVPLFFRLKNQEESQEALIAYQKRRYHTKLDVVSWTAPPLTHRAIRAIVEAEEAEREMKLAPHSPERIV